MLYTKYIIYVVYFKFYALYLRIFHSSLVSRQRTLKSEVLLNKKELLQTSAQDQFAKWAKLRRSVDKGLSELEKTSESLFVIPCRMLPPLALSYAVKWRIP